MIKIIDYGLGNVGAFQSVYKRLNIPVEIARTTDDLINATKLILPGVGAFDHAMRRIRESGLCNLITHLVLQRSVPVLGVCVGMQMMAASSSEGQSTGLGWINGKVKKIDSITSSFTQLPLPHMGWNEAKIVSSNPLFEGLEQGARFYFLHSYYIECEHSEDIIAESDYNKNFTCAINHKNIYGVQFHPEKSHKYGVQLLNNFAEL